MQAHAYFALNKSKAGEAYEAPVIEARRVKAGDPVIINMGLPVQTRAAEDGWQISSRGAHDFKNDADFARQFKKVEYKPTRDLPADATVEPVKKGDRIFTQPWDDTDMGVAGKAETDGYIVRLPEKGNKARFMSRSAFNNTFRNAAEPAANDDSQGMYQYVPQRDDKPIRFLVLPKDTIFAFKAGPFTAEAGSVLFENPDDEDGYTSIAAENFFANVWVARPARTPGGPVPRQS